MANHRVLSIISGTLLAFTLGACDDGVEDKEVDERTGWAADAYKEWLTGKVRDRVDAAGITPTAAAPDVSSEMFALGQALAFDKELSGNRNISCMTCHHPSVGTDDDRSLPAGTGATGLGLDRTGGPIIPRNAPALFNLHAYGTMFWDSRVSRSGDDFSTPAGAQLTDDMEAVFADEANGFGIVAAQAMFPVTSREEMRGGFEHDDTAEDNELALVANDDFTGIWSGLMTRLGAIDGYPEMFEAAYPGTDFEDMTFAHAANAIAGFEVSAFAADDSPWEQFLAGDDDAMSIGQLQGAKDFFDVGCINCHSGSMLSDFQHYNTGLPQFGPGKGAGPTGQDDIGREGVTGDEDDRYAFRAQPLVNAELTGPYGHDGQYTDLERFITHYSDPEGELRGYDITAETVQENIWDTQYDNTDAVLAILAGEVSDLNFGRRGWVQRARVRRLTRFMGALTDDDSRELSWTVPGEVPSGLPVAD